MQMLQSGSVFNPYALYPRFWVRSFNGVIVRSPIWFDSHCQRPARAKATTTFERKVAAVGFSSPADFPVSLVPSKKYGVLYMVTRSGYLYLFDLLTVPMAQSHWSRAYSHLTTHLRLNLQRRPYREQGRSAWV